MAGLAQAGPRASPAGSMTEGVGRSAREAAPQVPAAERPLQPPAEPSSVDAGTSAGPLLGGTVEKASGCSVDQSGGGQEVSVPDAPNSSIQFQADWKRLSGNQTALSIYFKVASLQLLSSVRKHSVCIYYNFRYNTCSFYPYSLGPGLEHFSIKVSSLSAPIAGDRRFPRDSRHPTLELCQVC